jgi:hypothetical protein
MDGTSFFSPAIQTTVDATVEEHDLGPVPRETMEIREASEYVEAFGFIDDGCTINNMSEEDKEINNKIQRQLKEQNKFGEYVMDWPSIEQTPVKEWGTTKVFARAFPWLFPGGIGDVKDFDGDISDWGKLLTYYKDGRFVKDTHFCFFALNYIVRHRNNSAGHWFVTKYAHGMPDTLEELQEQIRNGDYRYINHLNFYNKRIRGSNPYWRQEKSKLYTWINYHIKEGNGAPMFFITLSCAEHYWPDIIHLLKERMMLAGEDTSTCYVGSPKLGKIINEYAIVVQEYFERRVEIWMKTVGKEMLGIAHYWMRFEFAPGRGQIHVHLLAISSDQAIYKLCHTYAKDGNESKRAGPRRNLVSQPWPQMNSIALKLHQMNILLL